ncbi:MAG: hypothetical protein JXJ22_15020 [Bacteroidales bacterium]|nr:hypothetical protein [Bacteroidales bacterium]
MNRLISFTFILLNISLPAFGTGVKHRKIPAGKIEQLVVRYDPSVLRIPGNKLPISISVVLKNGSVTNTRGYLDGTCKWRNFKLEVDGGSFFNGRILISKNLEGLPGEELMVHVYHRKSGQLLKSQAIPLNYETKLYLMPVNDFRKAPGNKVDLVIKTEYNNGSTTEFNPYSNRSVEKKYTYFTSGAEMLFGNLRINDDPFSINKHTITLMTYLKKNLSVGDTLNITLDYRDDFKSAFYGFSGFNGFSGTSGNSGSAGQDGGHGGYGECGDFGSQGPDLEVFADVYFDTIIHEELLYIEIKRLSSGDIRKYLVNTDGGFITICSYGGDGGDGGDGGVGGDGGDGYDGDMVTETIHINDSTTEVFTYQLPGGPGGNGGDGGQAGDGGDGGRGGDIYIVYTQYAKPHLHLIQAYSRGGDGGDGGRGGSEGDTGSGGSGDPSGSSGYSGRSGSDGYDGWDGSDGEVYWEMVELE